MLEEQEREQVEVGQQLERIATAVEHLPGHLANAMRSQRIGMPKRPSSRRMFAEAEREHREAKQAKRRADIAIGLTGMTALASLIAALATLLHG